MLNAEFGRFAFRTQRSASAAGAEPRIVVELEPEPGRTLLELLARQTRLLLSNCGGRGRCGKCRVRIVAGQVSPPSAREQALLKACELKQGIRLACACSGASRIRLELPEWIVMNPKPSPARRATVIQQPTPAVLHQLGLAVDVGTTNVAVELVVLASGRVLRASSFLNPQASFGLDVVSRIGQSPAVIADNALVPALKGLLAEWQVRPTRLRRIVAVGNTAMCHFLLGQDATSLGHYPYPSQLPLGRVLRESVARLGQQPITILPLIGSYLGADTVAGLVATRMAEQEQLQLLIDLGTNGELVLGNRDRLSACSTAAGPAFEGANLSCGVLARRGAIYDVSLRHGQMRFVTQGRRQPIGICGSAVVKLLAQLRRTGQLTPGGRLVGSSSLVLVSARASGTGRDIILSQADVRELQLAKAAIAAGIKVLLKDQGIRAEALTRVHLTGQLGGRLDCAAARAIGLVPDVPGLTVVQHPNLALAGARRVLLEPSLLAHCETVAQQTKEVVLSNHPEFTDLFAGSMDLAPWLRDEPP